MVGSKFREEMKDASDAELSALLLAVAQLLAERKGRPLGFVEADSVSVLLGVGPLARLVRLANQGIADHFTSGADRAGVIEERRMAARGFPTPAVARGGREEG